MPESRIKYAVREGLYEDCPFSYEQIKELHLRTCYDCKMSNMSAFSRMRHHNHLRYAPMEYIGVDYKGPFSTMSAHHCNGFYLLSDHRSGAFWSYPCRGKGEDILHEILKHFFSLTKQYACKPPRILHCDDDSVETGGLISDFILEKGVNMHVSPPHVHR